MPPLKKPRNSASSRKMASPSLRPAKRRSRERSRPSFLQEFKKTIFIVCGVLLLCSGAWFVHWVIRPQGLWDRLTSHIEFYIQKSGFKIDAILVEGRRYTPAEDIQNAIHVQKGDLPFSADPWLIKQRLEQLPWVRSAVVQRQWPSTIYVRLLEQYPIALWQRDGKYLLIDDHGHILQGHDLKEFSTLPVLTGENVPRAAPALLEILHKFPNVLKYVTGATFISGRRWDLIINDKLTIKLPEEDIQDELEYLTRLLKEGDLEAKNIISIDLRTPDRAYFYMKDEMIKRKILPSSK